MKKVFSIVISLLLVTALISACAPAAPAPAPAPAPAADAADSNDGEEPAPPVEGGTVAGVVFQEDQFMRLLLMGYEDTARAAGFGVKRAFKNRSENCGADFRPLKIPAGFGQKQVPYLIGELGYLNIHRCLVE